MKEKRNFFLLTDPTAKTTTTGIAAPMKEAQRDEATRMRTVDEAQLQGASKPLLTYVLVIIRIHLFATLLVSGNDDMSFGNVVFVNIITVERFNQVFYGRKAFVSLSRLLKDL